MDHIYSYITFGSSILLVILILVQTRGAELGASFGGTGAFHTARRGPEKTIFNLTILVAIVFVGSILLNLLNG